MRGRHIKEVQELLGHASVPMTERYSHLSPDRLREAVAALEGLGSAVDKSALSTPEKAPAQHNVSRQRDRIACVGRN